MSAFDVSPHDQEWLDNYADFVAPGEYVPPKADIHSTKTKGIKEKPKPEDRKLTIRSLEDVEMRSIAWLERPLWQKSGVRATGRAQRCREGNIAFQGSAPESPAAAATCCSSRRRTTPKLT